MPLLPVLKRTQATFEPRDVEAFACLDDISIGKMETPPNNLEDQHRYCNHLGQNGCLVLEGARTYAGTNALLEGISIRIAERSGAKTVGVFVGTDKYARESAMNAVPCGGAEQLKRMLPRMLHKQPANLTATGSMVPRTAYLERVMGPELFLLACQKADSNAMSMLENCVISRRQQKNRRFRGPVHDKSVDPATLPTGAGEPVSGGRGGWAVVG